MFREICIFVIFLVNFTYESVPSCYKPCEVFEGEYFVPICAKPESGIESPMSFSNECVLNNFNCLEREKSKPSNENL
jgi:hypothetical protein